MRDILKSLRTSNYSDMAKIRIGFTFHIGEMGK